MSGGAQFPVKTADPLECTEDVRLLLHVIKPHDLCVPIFTVHQGPSKVPLDSPGLCNAETSCHQFLDSVTQRHNAIKPAETAKLQRRLWEPIRSQIGLQDVNEALRRLPQEEQDLRLQRLKRAVDCSLKKQYLPKDVQAAQTPYNFYLDVSF